MSQGNVVSRVYKFYRDGFRGMTLGRTLWALILLKLFIMFAILKIFFFPNLLSSYDKSERGDVVIEHLVKIKP